MINEKEVQAWIARLETENSSWANYEKLAILYVIQNQHKEQTVSEPIAMYSNAPSPVQNVVYGDSDFLQAVSTCAPEKTWSILDELMDSLKITNVRVYDNVMRKMRG